MRALRGAPTPPLETVLRTPTPVVPQGKTVPLPGKARTLRLGLVGGEHAVLLEHEGALYALDLAALRERRIWNSDATRLLRALEAWTRGAPAWDVVGAGTLGVDALADAAYP